MFLHSCTQLISLHNRIYLYLYLILLFFQLSWLHCLIFLSRNMLLLCFSILQLIVFRSIYITVLDNYLHLYHRNLIHVQVHPCILLQYLYHFVSIIVLMHLERLPVYLQLCRFLLLLSHLVMSVLFNPCQMFIHILEIILVNLLYL